jgi:site-specific recombinase XerD
MIATAAVAAEQSIDLLGAYERFVDALGVNDKQRWERRRGGRVFLERHPDLVAWMTRPTSARLADLHRVKAWPFFTWLVVDGRLRPDLELLLAKPGGVDLGMWWSIAHTGDVALAHEIADRLGWSPNWARQVIRHTAPVVCLWLGKTLPELTDGDFDSAAREAERVNVRLSTSARFAGRCLALRQLCFQAGIVNCPPRDSKPPALLPAEHAAAIAQPDIRRDVIRYAEVITTTLRPATAQMRVKAIRVLADWLTEHHPDVTRFEQLDRSRHIEPFLAWSRTRPRRGPNGNGKTVGMTVFHHDLVDLRVFFEDIAEWGWPTAPQRRLLFLSDLPRLPEPMPRALAPDTDRALMTAVAALDDPFARCGLTLLRATGMRAGELLDLELDCTVDFDAHGTWLRVPLGKLGTERMVPLDPEPLALLDAWIANRGQQRSLPHPRHGRLTDFVFVERGRRIGAHRAPGRPTRRRRRRRTVRPRWERDARHAPSAPAHLRDQPRQRRHGPARSHGATRACHSGDDSALCPPRFADHSRCLRDRHGQGQRAPLAVHHPRRPHPGRPIQDRLAAHRDAQDPRRPRLLLT